MSHGRIARSAMMATIVASILVLTACGGASVPDKYNYDDFTKYVKLGRYKNLEYTKSNPNVSDAEVQDAITAALDKAKKKTEVKEGTAEANSIVNIDYTGKINGRKFDGGTAKGYELNLADSNFISGFAEQVVGHKVGETFDINVTFPANYSNNSELSGKAAVFTIKINSIVKTVIPEYNDEFVTKNTKFKTKAEYEKNIKKQLLKDKKVKAASAEKQEIFSQILEASKIKKYPDKELKAAYNSMISTYKELAKKNDTSYENYLKNNLGMDKATFEKQANTAAKNTVRQELVLHALAEKYKIKITDSEYNDYLDKLLKDAGYTRSQYEKASGMKIEKYAEQNNLFDTMLYERVMDKVLKDSIAK